ncbi:S8 family peptidase [Luteococcus sp. Sow4_B9]|uniref:S8 family peptidase n=1 Tax=Luteococcus sp. Sow4_B9 TaxID=3438792 RepID=UPI003F96C017
MRLPQPSAPLARLVAPALALALVATGLVLLPSQAAPDEETDRWIVRYDSPRSARSIQAASTRGGGRIKHQFSTAFPGMAVEMTPRNAAALRGMKGVVSVTPDHRMRAADVQDIPPAGLDRIDQVTSRGTRSYTSTRNGSGVRAYVVDSGLNLGHTDFTGRIIEGPNLVNQGDRPTDCSGHGTHVAGILAGTRFGVAKRTTVTPIKVLDCDGGGYASDTIAALEWVVKDHAAGRPAVLNLSLAGPVSPELTSAVNSVIADGVTVVAAAGNADPGSAPTSACNFGPANVPGVLTVANSTTFDQQSPTSNFGSCVDLYAPGTGIRSAWIGGASATATDDGTSMATPHVAGAAALLLQARPTWTPAQVHSQIVSQSLANRISNPSPGTPNRLLHTLSPITPGQIEHVGRPGISGTPTVGSRLSATPGTWGNGRVTLRGQWYRVSSTGTRTAITGATGTSLVLSTADRGQRVQYTVTASKVNYANKQASSPLTSVVS